MNIINNVKPESLTDRIRRLFGKTPSVDNRFKREVNPLYTLSTYFGQLNGDTILYYKSDSVSGIDLYDLFVISNNFPVKFLAGVINKDKTPLIELYSIKILPLRREYTRLDKEFSEGEKRFYDHLAQIKIKFDG